MGGLAKTIVNSYFIVRVVIRIIQVVTSSLKQMPHEILDGNNDTSASMIIQSVASVRNLEVIK